MKSVRNAISPPIFLRFGDSIESGALTDGLYDLSPYWGSYKLLIPHPHLPSIEELPLKKIRPAQPGQHAQINDKDSSLPGLWGGRPFSARPFPPHTPPPRRCIELNARADIASFGSSHLVTPTKRRIYSGDVNILRYNSSVRAYADTQRK